MTSIHREIFQNENTTLSKKGKVYYFESIRWRWRWYRKAYLKHTDSRQIERK